MDKSNNLILGVGYGTSGHSNHPAYSKWYSMLERCYNPKLSTIYPTYEGCYVHPIWHDLGNFISWYDNYPHKEDDWHLDKDILSFGNKVYGPDTCCLVPAEINSLFKKRRKDSSEVALGVCIEKDHDYDAEYYVSIDLTSPTPTYEYFENIDDAADFYWTGRQKRISQLVDKWGHLLTTPVLNVLLDDVKKDRPDQRLKHEPRNSPAFRCVACNANMGASSLVFKINGDYEDLCSACRTEVRGSIYPSTFVESDRSAIESHFAEGLTPPKSVDY